MEQDKSSSSSTSSTEESALISNFQIENPFPYLKTSGLSIKEKDELFERLLLESMTIRLAFASLVSNTVISLMTQDISSSKIHDELKSSKLNHYKTVAGVESVGMALGNLGEYWGFSDNSLLEQIILKLGTSEDKQSLEKYRQGLAEFAQRRIFECPTGMFGPSLGQSEELVTVKRKDQSTILNDMSLNQVQIISAILKSEMGVEPSDMRLVSYHKQEHMVSLELIFCMLALAAESLFPLSGEKEERMASLGVWHVSCGEYIFQRDRDSPSNSDEVNAGSLSDEEQEDKEPEDTTLIDTAINEPILLFTGTMTCKDEDMGSHTSISVNNKKVVVEVSSCSNSSYKSYKVGRLRGDLLQWQSGLRGVRYGTGKAPRIALNDEGYVVEVDEETDGKISCRVGIMHTSNVMIWTEGVVFTSGSNPSIALCHRTVITAFKRGDNAFYRIGTVDTIDRSIVWSTQEHRFISGASDLSLASNEDGTVVAIYTKQMVTSAISPLYVMVGELDGKSKRIFFSSIMSSSQNLTVGKCPSVAVSRGNNVTLVSIQQKTGIQRKIKYKLGLVKKGPTSNARDVVWSSEDGLLEFSSRSASVAMNDKGTVLVSHSLNEECFCHIGRVFHETTI